MSTPVLFSATAMRLAFFVLLSILSCAALAEPSVSVVRVLKSKRTLQLWAGPQLLREFPIALGRNPLGHKQQEGDGRTPEGRYVLDAKKADSAFYKAIHVSYPNAQDSAAARARGVAPGGQIMIHGQKNGLGWLSFFSQRLDWTQGCIALSNADMDEVWRLTPVGAPVEIRP